MATTNPITKRVKHKHSNSKDLLNRVGPFKPLEAPRETALSNAFSTLLSILSEYTKAEHDLEDIGYSQDPAYAAWHDASDHAQDRLIDVLRDLQNLPLEVPEDILFRRMALLLHEMRWTDGKAARYMHERLQDNFYRWFQVLGDSPTASHRKLLLNWSRPIIAAFLALPLFDGGVDDEAGPDKSDLLDIQY
ncbi:MAG: hypothetical protein Q7J57_17265 [Gemmobacter sp.]|nr:hypothetical protein [Gemmobacter sp.]